MLLPRQTGDKSGILNRLGDSSNAGGMIHSERMQHIYQDFEITDDQSSVDFAVVQSWLAGSYWSPGISRAKVEQAAKYSALVVGAYL